MTKKELLLICLVMIVGLIITGEEAFKSGYDLGSVAIGIQARCVIEVNWIKIMGLTLWQKVAVGKCLGS